MGPMGFMAARFIVAIIVLIPFAVPHFKFITWSEYVAGSVLGMVLSLSYIFQTIGLETTTSGKTAFITSLNIIFVPMFGMMFFAKRPLLKDRVGVLLALVGFGLLSLNGKDLRVESGDLWVLACAVLYAVQVLLVDRYARAFHPFRVNFVQMLSAGAVCIVGALIFETNDWDGARRVGVPILLTAVFATAYPFVGQMYAQRKCSPTVAALILSLEALFAVLFGFLIDHEVLPPRELLGCAIILAAVFVVLSPSNLPQRRRQIQGSHK